MIRNDQIQAGLIAYLKLQSAILTLLVDVNGESVTEEIREDQYQSREFSYPNIRVRVISNIPNKCWNEVNIGIQCFSEQASSQESDKLAGTVAEAFEDTANRPITFTANGLQNCYTITNIIPAFRADKRTWRAEVMLRGHVT